MGDSNRALIAKKYVEYINSKYKKEIAESIKNTEMHNDVKFYSKLENGTAIIKVEPIDSVEAVIKGNGKRQCLLNFASYKHPGGGFLGGSMAQEEALCHESTLYSILVNFQKSFYDKNSLDTNNALYRNKALYTRDVIFERNKKAVASDVLSCACPNWNAAKSKGITKEQNETALRSRIKYILMLASSHQINRLILGAYGCGVFGQDAKVVARIFHEEITKTLIHKKIEIVFAIPKGNGNYEAFKKEFEKEKNRWARN